MHVWHGSVHPRQGSIVQLRHHCQEQSYGQGEPNLAVRAAQVALRTLAAFTEARTQQVLDDSFNATSQPTGTILPLHITLLLLRLRC